MRSMPIMVCARRGQSIPTRRASFACSEILGLLLMAELLRQPGFGAVPKRLIHLGRHCAVTPIPQPHREGLHQQVYI